MELLRKWFRQAEVGAGERRWLTGEEHAEIRRLMRENAGLCRANDILKAAVPVRGVDASGEVGATTISLRLAGGCEVVLDEADWRANE